MPPPAEGLQTPSGIETPSGMASVVSTVPGGLETPDFLELRKTAAARPAPSSDDGPRSLYTVVPERQTSVRGLMGSERGYDVSGLAGTGAVPVLGEERGTKRKAGGVELSIDAEALAGMSEDELRRRYQEGARGGANVPGGREDFSDVVAQESAKRKKQEKEREQRKKGKDKDFRF
jgi:splicing factor 3B subunit 2